MPISYPPLLLECNSLKDKSQPWSLLQSSKHIKQIKYYADFCQCPQIPSPVPEKDQVYFLSPDLHLETKVQAY